MSEHASVAERSGSVAKVAKPKKEKRLQKRAAFLFLAPQIQMQRFCSAFCLVLEGMGAYICSKNERI